MNALVFRTFFGDNNLKRHLDSSILRVQIGDHHRLGKR